MKNLYMELLRMVEVINARCVQPKNKNNDDSPVNPGSHICGGGSASGAGGRADFNGFRNESDAREAAYRSDIIQGIGGGGGTDEQRTWGVIAGADKTGGVKPNSGSNIARGNGNAKVNNPSNVQLTSSSESDQKLTFSQARAWYRLGGGAPMNVNLNTIDFSRVSMSDFDSRGLATVRLAGQHFANLDDALVHGTIILQRLGNTNQAKLALNSDPTTPELNGKPAAKYDFEILLLGD